MLALLLVCQPIYAGVATSSRPASVAATRRKRGATASAKISCVLIACQCAKPPGLAVIAISVRPSHTSMTAGDARGDVLGRPDPDDVALDHLLVGRRRELLHDPGGVEAVAGGLERLAGASSAVGEALPSRNRRIASSASRRATSRSSSM